MVNLLVPAQAIVHSLMRRERLVVYAVRYLTRNVKVKTKTHKSRRKKNPNLSLLSRYDY
jgi:hypothetical protein